MAVTSARPEGRRGRVDVGQVSDDLAQRSGGAGGRASEWRGCRRRRPATGCSTRSMISISYCPAQVLLAQRLQIGEGTQRLGGLPRDIQAQVPPHRSTHLRLASRHRRPSYRRRWRWPNRRSRSRRTDGKVADVGELVRSVGVGAGGAGPARHAGRLDPRHWSNRGSTGVARCRLRPRTRATASRSAPRPTRVVVRG